MSLDPLRRRALVNGGIAGVVTLVIGIGVIAGISSLGEGDDSPSPTPSAATPTPTQPACTPTFDVAQTADPGDLPNALAGVTALSSAEAWAVGASGDPLAPVAVLIERWDGAAWTAEQGPSPGSETNELRAVDAAEPNDVWAVGRTASGFGDRPLVLRFDGTEWLEIVLPEEVTGVLTGVAAISPDDVWVVGYEGDPVASLERALVLHWDGQVWEVDDPGRAVGSGRSALLGIEAVAPDDVWAVGYLHSRPLIVHFDGEAWSRSETTVDGETNAIAPTTPTDVWAVGSPIQRFDGATWTSAAEIRADGELFGIAVVSPSDLWAVGRRPVQGGGTRSLVMRFDGLGWTQVEGASVPGSDALLGVDALSDGTVLAVGYKDVEAGRRTLAILGSTCFPES
ncbi:MAG TPA: hypothetical protein VID69_09735 [Actinomycetota bacterium]